MAYTSFGLNDSETVKLWEKMLHKAERETLDIAPLMGKSDNAIIHIKEETEKGAGDRVTFTLRTRLTQKGITSSGTVEGNRLKWEMKVTQPMPITLKYDLTIEGNALSGTAKLGMFGKAKVSGERVGGGAPAVEPAAVAAEPAPEPAPASEPAAATTIDGNWNMVMKPPVGPEQQMVATFNTDGGTLTGKLEAPEGTQEFAGTVDGNRLKWEMKVTQPMPITLKYDLTVEGDALSGTAKLGMFGKAKVQGTRAS